MSKIQNLGEHGVNFQPFVRSAYNYDTAKASDESGLRCEDISLTQQQFKDDSDPNKIMEIFARDPNSAEGLFRAGGAPQFGDFTSSVDYHTSLNRVRNAQAAFDSMPAKLRNRFDNDPAQLLAFINDSKNYDEAFQLGLVKERPQAKPEGLSIAPAASKAAQGAVGKAGQTKPSVPPSNAESE